IGGARESLGLSARVQCDGVPTRRDSSWGRAALAALFREWAVLAARFREWAPLAGRLRDGAPIATRFRNRALTPITLRNWALIPILLAAVGAAHAQRDDGL